MEEKQPNVRLWLEPSAEKLIRLFFYLLHHQAVK